MSSETIMVSIICNTYNHERYIKDALEGFVNQKTNFPFEVLIHDDASTDDTADIIRKYEREYPEIIKPIYQENNQYTQHISILSSFQYPRIRGKYVAICEGDDYWTDSKKLEKQVLQMENYPSVDICAHASVTIDDRTGFIIKKSKLLDHIGIIPTESVILGGGGFVATASLMYRSSILKDLPQFRKNIGLDYFTQVHGALRGGMLYLPDEMSVYRANVAKSWTQRVKKDSSKKIAHKKRVLLNLKQMDKDTDGKYHRAISRVYCRNYVKLQVYRLKELIKYVKQ